MAFRTAKNILTIIQQHLKEVGTNQVINKVFN